jgi:hypothetical protein
MGGRHERRPFGAFQPWKAAVVVGVALGGLPLTTAGCSVAESDVRRWETTQRGPYKLVAVVTHDKYDLDLRTEAALSLVRMPPRGGVRKGISFLIDRYTDEDGDTREGALAQLPEESRREIVDRMAPELVAQLQAPPPPRTEDGRLPPDPTIPYKDATFALLTHEPRLVSNEATRQNLRQALVQWVQKGFEDRIENGAQQYPMEQMMRHLGPETVTMLPGIVNENTARLDRVTALVADIGDPPTKLAMSKALVSLAERYHTKEWLDAQTAVVKDHNAKSNVQADETQVAAQVDKMQERRLTEEVFPSMKRVGERPAIDYLFTFGADAQKPPERRKLALAALEGHVDKGNPKDLDRLFAIAKSNDTPDAARDVAFARLGELPKEQIVPKLYTLFDNSQWKVRWVAASLVLKTMSPKQVDEFMRHLPKSPATKMGMTEPLSYGGLIRAMEPPPGEPTPREVITPHLSSKDFGPKMTALGFFWEGQKADQRMVKPHADDKTPLPKCDPEEECSWSCDVPKPGSPDEVEPRELTTVGEFVTLCLLPSMEK